MTFWDKRTKIGRDGEVVVQGFIQEKLNYRYEPVRDIDLGIDGEIEITTPAHKGKRKGFRPTGAFLKVQVKTTEKLTQKKSFSVKLSKDHLQYYAALTVPIILVAVCLDSRRIWWKHIDGIQAYLALNESSLRFDIAEDILDKNSAYALKLLADLTNAKFAEYLLLDANDILDQQESEQEEHGLYTEHFEVWADQLVDCENLARSAATLLRYERRSSRLVDDVKYSLHSLRSRITGRKQIFIDNLHKDKLLEAYPDPLRDL